MPRALLWYIWESLQSHFLADVSIKRHTSDRRHVMSHAEKQELLTSVDGVGGDRVGCRVQLQVGKGRFGSAIGGAGVHATKPGTGSDGRVTVHDAVNAFCSSLDQLESEIRQSQVQPLFVNVYARALDGSLYRPLAVAVITVQISVALLDGRLAVRNWQFSNRKTDGFD